MPLDDFSVQTETLAVRKQQVIVLHVAGCLDAHTFEELDEAINALFARRLYRIIVDLSGVTYVSSAGAGVFIGALSEAQENDGNIIILNPTASVREVFDLLGLAQIFRIADNQPSALAAFEPA